MKILKNQGNDSNNRYLIDAPDIQRLLALHKDKMDMQLVREYFKIFGKEDLLDDLFPGL